MCVVHNPIGRADVGPQRARVARDRVGSPQNAVQRALLLPPRGARRTSTGRMWRSRGAGCASSLMRDAGCFLELLSHRREQRVRGAGRRRTFAVSSSWGCSLEGGDGSREFRNEGGRGRDAAPSVGRRRGVARALQGRDLRVDARGAVRRSMRPASCRIVLFVVLRKSGYHVRCSLLNVFLIQR